MTERSVRCDLGVSGVHTPGAMGQAGGYSQRQHAAIAIVRDAKGRVLTVSRPEPPHEMALPGGHVEDGESAIDAAVRELAEETGMHAQHAVHVADLASPTDGRPVHVYRVHAHGRAFAAEQGTRVAWLTPNELLAQSALYRPTVEALMEHMVSRPLADDEEHDRALSISASRRKALPLSKFAWPEQRKYPVDTPERVRAAASYLVKEHRAGKVPDGEFPRIKARIARAARRFGIDSEFNESDHAPAGRGKNAIHIRADLAPGGALHVRHANMNDDGAQLVVTLDDGTYGLRDVRRLNLGEEVDPATVGVKLVGASTYKDGSPKKLVWVQIAECGVWKGHPAGAFEMTPATFDEIVRNFSARGLPVPFDYEHASEQDPTSGSIPQAGAPAPGWVHRLENRREGGLWGLTEWLDKAREQVKEGEYAFLSPAIRFGCKDPRTGTPIGARLTSVALTNQPFLTGLAGLRAAKDDGVKTGAPRAFMVAAERFDLADLAKGQLSRKTHASADVMPRIKQALKLHPLSTPSEVSQHIERLRDACMSAGPDAIYAGENLHDYMRPLTDLVSPPLGSSWEDVLDALDEFVDAEIDKHVAHGVPLDLPSSTAPMADDPDEEDMTMSDKDTAHLKALKDAQDKADGLAADLEKKNGEIKTLTDKVASHEQLFAAKDAQITELTEKVTARDSVIASKDGEIKTLSDRVASLEGELKTLRDAEEARIVGERFDSYKDRTKMTKESFAALYKADRALFDKEFPEIAPNLRHLQREIVRPELREPGKDPGGPQDFDAVVQNILATARQEKRPMTLAEAQEEASARLRRPR